MAVNGTGARLGVVGVCCLLAAAGASTVFAGFASTETYLVAVGRAPGQLGTQIFSTVWATNLSGAPNAFTAYFLKQGQANASPASFSDTLAPGETKIYENIVESKFHVTGAIGAVRLVSDGEILVSERIFNQAPGDDLGNTEGFFFAGVPKTFSISSGGSASIQGVNQGGAENFRYNFVLVETGGASATVNVQAFDSSGILLGQKSYPLLPREQLIGNVGDIVPTFAAIAGRITATVTGGTGSVLLAGAQIANESQDASGFEMSFPGSLLGTTGGGLTSVIHDASLAGAGTVGSPLSIANGQVVRSINGLHDNVTLFAGSNVTITPNGSTLTISSAGGGGGGLTLPFSGTDSSGFQTFTIANTNDGIAIVGSGKFGISGQSNSSNGAGVIGQNGASFGVGVSGTGQGAGVSGTGVLTGVSGSASGTGSVGVSGTADNGYGVEGTTTSGLAGVVGLSLGNGYGVYAQSDSGDGLFGTSTSFNGVEGSVTNNSAGVAGVNKGTGPGVYGENVTAGYAGDFLGDVIVGGTIFYTGSVMHTSDARFKKEVEPLENALERTLMLRGVTFDWRRDEFPERRFRARRDLGFIAQEVETVYPELVSTGRDGYKSVDYSALTPVLVEAIKEQQRKIDLLTRRIEELEADRK